MYRQFWSVLLNLEWSAQTGLGVYRATLVGNIVATTAG